MSSKHKSEDFKMSAVEYYLTEDVSQEQVCRIFKCSPRSFTSHCVTNALG